MIDTKNGLLQKFKKNAELTTAAVQIVSNDENEISNALKSQTYSENKVLISVKNLELLASYLKSVTPIFKPSNEEITSIPFCITDSVGGIAETATLAGGGRGCSVSVGSLAGSGVLAGCLGPARDSGAALHRSTGTALWVAG